MAVERDAGPHAYGATARFLHWLMAGLVIFQISAGLIMVYAPEGSIWASLSDVLGLYSLHKLLGLILLALVFIRLAWRIGHGTPPEEPSLAVWQRETSALVHSWIYLVLIVLPILGWVGISLYPAVRVFEAFDLPSLVAQTQDPKVAEQNQAKSAAVFVAHGIAAFVLIGLVLMHIGAALYHHLIRKDGVLLRMLPGLQRRT